MPFFMLGVFAAIQNKPTNQSKKIDFKKELIISDVFDITPDIAPAKGPVY